MDALDIFDLVIAVKDIFISIGSSVAKVIPTHRECTVELTNDASNYSLSSPSTFIRRGQCSIPLPALIQASTSASAVFSKSKLRAQGCIGTFTYDICDASQNAVMKAVVMFKVPFNNGKKHPIMYGVGLFDVNKACDGELYREMTEGTGTFVSGKASGPALTYTSHNITIMASMSDCHASVMKVHVTEH